MQDQDPTEGRLRFLHELRGADLVAALTKELNDLHQQVTQLQREMSAYRDYQAARDRWLMTDTAQQARVDLPKSVTIDASHFLHPRQGFYGLENNTRGFPFSWTGPSRNFSFDVFVDRTRGAELELRAASCIDFERQKDIKLLANGESVITHVSKDGSGLVLKASLPPTTDDRGTNLVFFVPEVIQPPNSKEGRAMGIAFQSLSLTSRRDSRAAAKAKQPDETVVALSRSAANKHADEEAPAPAVAPKDAAAS